MRPPATPPRSEGSRAQALTDAESRVALYRRAARALERFFARWTAPFCRRCLQVVERTHPGDPAVDVELVAGRFPGCCQAGVADGLWVPGRGPAGRFPGHLVRAFLAARREAGTARSWAPPEYRVRERRTGRIQRGVGCRYLGAGGCVLGDLKAPLCLTFVCRGILEALAGACPELDPRGDTQDFAGAAGVFFRVVGGDREDAEAAVAGLEERLQRMDGALAKRFGTGEALWKHWIEGKGERT